MPIPVGFAQHVSGFLIKLSDQSGPYSFDGTNAPVIVPASATIADTAALLTYTAAAAGGAPGADQTNSNARGVKLVIDITALTGVSPTLLITLQGKDAASGKYYSIGNTGNLSAVATTTFDVYPGLAAGATSANSTLPRVWRVTGTISGTTPTVTATVGASLII